MDDLYGDLPPASGEEKKETTGLIGSAWSSLPLQQKAKDAATTTNKTVVPSAAPTVVKTTKFVPSSLLFKPRQTTAPSSSSSSSSAANSNSTVNTTVQQSARNRSMSIDPQPQTVPVIAEQKIEVMTSMVPCIEEKLEFNNNASFEVGDAYDPRRPNDYLTFCKEREESKRLEKLAEDNKKRLEEMEQARAELERQRRDAAEKQDYRSLVSSSLTEKTGGGRGRGRGVSNLPSWIVQQMKEEEESQPAAAVVTDSIPQQFQDATAMPASSNELQSQPVSSSIGTKRKASHFSKPSNVILLKNMVGVEDVDGSLAFETKMECQKYGSVQTCRVAVVDQQRYPRCPMVEQVRTFVQFDRQDAAVKALKEMNGRFFGGRQISATFFDEDKYRNNLLDPDETDF